MDDEMKDMALKIKGDKMSSEDALNYMESSCRWHLYKDHEKREMAFKLGVIWALKNIE